MLTDPANNGNPILNAYLIITCKVRIEFDLISGLVSVSPHSQHNLFKYNAFISNVMNKDLVLAYHMKER